MTAVVSVLEIAAMSIGFSIIAIAFFMGHKKAPYLFTYIGAIVYRRILAAAITLLINGGLELDDLFMSATVIVLDILLVSVFAVIAHLFARSYQKKSFPTDTSSLFDTGDTVHNIDPIYPFKKIYDKGNILQSCLLTLGILLSAVKIISRSTALFIAIPDNIFMTVIGYIGDVLIVVISYSISCLLLSWLYSINEKRKAMRILYDKD